MRSVFLGSSLLAAMTLAGCMTAANSQTSMIHTDLSAAKEVPPTDSAGKGTAMVTIDKAAKTVSYSIEYSGLTGPATAAHFHGPAAPGTNAGVAVPIPNAGTSPINGTATLTDAQLADLLAGKYYINIHTPKNPGGEIRGWVTP